ncbi:PKD domain-containing protein [Hymenobacter sp. HMF4947]|uniref:PKD domain-containing protein n=1 Tax=Hymenobacter ginkgonis TaxID=2682976 RepID=A0A7K1TJ38_9BACT|nr:gliding motility-associated C-terminal domain-containing protein [Hymenobacter ginkgonis]MVN78382.1 PKD domain-containing protein [Hymenobacter ginkgonis]
MQQIFYALLLTVLGLSSLPAAAQPQPAPTPFPLAGVPPAEASLEFVANKGQWPAEVRYAAAVPGGHLCLEPGGLRYVFLQAIEHPAGGAPTPASATKAPAPPAATDVVRGHQLRVRFVGADAATPLLPADATTEVRNYLHGNDPAHWASAVPSYRQVRYQAPWPGVGARFYENATQHLEYDFEVAAGASADRIQLRYEGATSLTLSADGQLHVGTSVGDITELMPQAYQLDAATGARQPVACRYQLRSADATVSFTLGRYDHRRPLIIDPTVVFSTYSGAKGSNWGFTATYDAAGNMYSGGIVLNDMTALVSYPTTAGAFQTTFGGVIDIALIKYNTATNGAAARVWATYLGGDRSEFPSSLVVNAQNELLVLGSTSSSNYPTTRGALQRTQRGGPLAHPFGNFGSFYDVPTGTDIVVTRLAADGGSLAASTYLGGTGTDGLVAFEPSVATRQLPQNYGDALRGDIITDSQGNVYIASVSGSNNFPTTAGSFGPTYRGGTCDAVVCKLPADLSGLTWGGYLGGTAADAAYSLQLDAAGNVYVAGGTLSPALPGTAGGLMPTARGNVDGFVARIAANGSAVERATYLGTSSYDQAFFVQLGADGGVYLLGQTLGSWPVSGGVYSNPGSRQFIQKLSPDLDKSLISTVFGSGRSTIDISPTAFLVDQCDRVYACGWGGQVNQYVYDYATYVPTNGYTHGMATTPNAVRTTPDTPGFGSDFYLAQFTPGLGSLSYGTYYGDATPNSEGDHVDGGTSRFDPRGVVYAAVCSCFNRSGFPVPPGAYTYSPTNGGVAQPGYDVPCNNAAFKLNFEPTTATVGQSQTVCSTAAAIPLSGLPSGGVWTGPGVSGSVSGGFVFTPTPALVGAQTLTYTVAGVTAACVATGQQVITVVPTQVATLAAPPQTVYCLQAGVTPPLITLQGSPAGGTYAGPGVVGNTFSPLLAGGGIHTLTYTVGAGSPCPNTASIQIAVIGASAGADFTLCSSNGPVRLPSGQPAGGTWSGPGVSGSAATGFIFTPDPSLGSVKQTLTYSVASPTGTCTATAQVIATVVVPPVASAAPLPPVCVGSGPLVLTAGSPAGGVWTGAGVSPGSTPGTYVFTPTAGLVGTQVLTYTVTASQVCASLSSRATTSIQVLPVIAVALPPDTVLCPGNTQAFRLRASPSGGIWSGPGVSSGNLFTPPTLPSTVELTYVVGLGTPCPVTTTRRITLLAQPVLAPALVAAACVPSAVAPLVVHYRQPATTIPADAVLSWNFGDDSTAVTTGPDVTHTYTQAGTYRPRVTLRFNQSRCVQQLDLPAVEVKSMFIPNIVTPNGDKQNDVFAPRLGGCPARLQVFSRWGQRVYEDAAYQNTWGGADLAPGIYYYLLTPPDGSQAIKGWVELVR